MVDSDFAKNPAKPRQSRDIQRVEAALKPWFEKKLETTGDLTFTNVRIPEANSFSSEIILFDAQWTPAAGPRQERFAVRISPTKTALFFNPDFRTDFLITQQLYKTGAVPVPKAYWYEKNPRILGAPFCVFAQVDGKAAQDNPPYNVDGWLVEAESDERTDIWWAGINAMARLHQLDIQTSGLDFLHTSDNPTDELTHEIDYYADFYQWACAGKPLAIFGQSLTWLRAHMPTVDRLGFCWGDARMGNILFHERKCKALLDWEMASLGEPEKDLAYWLFFDRFNREGVGAPQRPGWPSHRETIERYEGLLGRPMRHLAFYEVFAVYRMAVILTRLIHLTATTMPRMDPDAAIRNHYFVTSMESLISC